MTLTSSAGFTTALQVGERVLDLAPVVEPRAADDLVRDADAHEVLLEHAALRVGPVEDGDVAPAAVALVVQRGDLVRDPLRLVALVVGVVAHDRLAAALSVHSSFGLRPRLLAITALAASRIVWVDR